MTQHKVIEGMAGMPALDSMPSASVDATDRILLIDHAQMLEDTEKFALAWQRSPRPLHVPTIGVDDMPDRSVYATVVTCMVELGAYVGSAAVYTPPTDMLFEACE